LHRYVIDTK